MKKLMFLVLATAIASANVSNVQAEAHKLYGANGAVYYYDAEEHYYMDSEGHYHPLETSSLQTIAKGNKNIIRGIGSVIYGLGSGTCHYLGHLAKESLISIKHATISGKHMAKIAAELLVIVAAVYGIDYALSYAGTIGLPDHIKQYAFGSFKDVTNEFLRTRFLPALKDIATNKIDPVLTQIGDFYNDKNPFSLLGKIITNFTATWLCLGATSELISYTAKL